MKERETDSSSNMRRRWTASMPESTATGVSPMAVWEDSEAARGIFREKKTEEGERDLRSEEEEEEWGWRSVVLMLLLNACWLSVTAIKDCAIVFSSWTVLRYLFISRFIIKSRSRGVLSIYGVWRVLTCILEKKIICVCEFFFFGYVCLWNFCSDLFSTPRQTFGWFLIRFAKSYFVHLSSHNRFYLIEFEVSMPKGQLQWEYVFDRVSNRYCYCEV